MAFSVGHTNTLQKKKKNFMNRENRLINLLFVCICLCMLVIYETNWVFVIHKSRYALNELFIFRWLQFAFPFILFLSHNILTSKKSYSKQKSSFESEKERPNEWQIHRKTYCAKTHNKNAGRSITAGTEVRKTFYCLYPEKMSKGKVRFFFVYNLYFLMDVFVLMWWLFECLMLLGKRCWKS